MIFSLILVFMLVPGYSLMGKLDHYLCLDGQWISRWVWVWSPGKNFLRKRQAGLALLSILAIALFWNHGQNGQSLSQKALSLSPQNQAVEGSVHETSKEERFELQKKRFSDHRVYGRNLRQKSHFVKGFVAPSSDEMHFYRENWIHRLPFEGMNE